MIIKIVNRYLEYFISNETKFNEAFDSITDGFTATKDAKAIREMGHFINEMKTCSIPLVSSDSTSWLRGREHFEAAAFLGKPFQFMNVEALNGRLVEHYRILYQEDVLIQESGVESIGDFELYKICNRRHIARWEEELNRSQLLERLNNWFALTAHEEGKHVPLRVVLMYQTAHFKDPGYLDASLDSLDTDAFPTSWDYAKDAFVRRLEFENGPLEEQVCIVTSCFYTCVLFSKHCLYRTKRKQNKTNRSAPTSSFFRSVRRLLRPTEANSSLRRPKNPNKVPFFC